jgi:glycosyltransferase involved in cell wall biosynthesis
MLLNIVIPTYNRANRVIKLLREISNVIILFQDSIHVTVVDGSSSQDQMTILRDYIQNNKVTLIENTKNIGAPACRNIGQKNVDSDYVWFIDDDDFIDGGELNDVIIKLDQQKKIETKLIFLQAIIIKDGVVAEIRKPIGNNLFKKLRKYGQKNNTSTAIIQSKIFREIGSWDEGLVSGQDTDLFLRLSTKTDAVVFDQYVLIYHGHESITTNPTKILKGKLQFIVKNYKLLHPIRRFYYFYTLILLLPYLKKIFRLR